MLQRRTQSPLIAVLRAVRRSCSPTRLFEPGPFRQNLAPHPPLRGPASHGNCELGICFAGRMMLGTPTRLVVLEAGDIVVIKPGTWHYETYERKDRPYRACWLVSLGSQVLCNISSYRKRKFEAHWLRGISADAEHGPMITELIRHLELRRPRWKARTRGTVARLLEDVRRSTANLAQPPYRIEFEPLDKLLKIMSARFREPIELRSLAREVGLTPNYLSLRFQETFHTTFTNYLNLLRVWHAQLLLEQGIAPKQAAVESGFKNVHYFTTVFRQKCGLPPSRYQRTSRATRDAPSVPRVGVTKLASDNGT